VSISAGMAAFRMSFQLSPIIFTGGIAANVPGGMLPIILITEALSFVQGILAGGREINLDDFFANFAPLPGSTLLSQQIGKYPFANQAVAANSVIRQPLKISMRMVCPARGPAGYAVKLATMTALRAAFALHNASGGAYTIATPSFFYTNCLMLDMVDTSQGASQQAQNTYQLDFEQPLLTLQDAVQAQNNLMARLTAGTPVGGNPTWSGLSPTVGTPPSLGAVGTIPAAGAPAGVLTAAPSPIPSLGGPF
jgi:hypothetical protein